MFRAGFLSIIRSLVLYTQQQVYVIGVMLTACQQAVSSHSATRNQLVRQFFQSPRLMRRLSSYTLTAGDGLKRNRHEDVSVKEHVKLSGRQGDYRQQHNQKFLIDSILDIKKQHVSAYHWPSSGFILEIMLQECCTIIAKILQ